VRNPARSWPIFLPFQSSNAVKKNKIDKQHPADTAVTNKLGVFRKFQSIEKLPKKVLITPVSIPAFWPTCQFSDEGRWEGFAVHRRQHGFPCLFIREEWLAWN
jgi:hypothetical protein